MELRLLQYFLAVARTGNVTRAAEALHITQPTLSRQISQLERELGTELFVRDGRKLQLSEKGILLRRRAEEIIELADLAQEEMVSVGSELSGTISIAWGDLASVNEVAQVVRAFAKDNPLVTFEFHTAAADDISERLDRGLADFGLILEPADVSRYDFIRLQTVERFVVAMRPDDPLAAKEALTPSDLAPLPLALPRRSEIRGELRHWFGDAFQAQNARFTSNLTSNGALMASLGMGYPIMTWGSVHMWRSDAVACRPLDPPLETGAVFVWRRDKPMSKAVRAFLDAVRAELS